MIILTGGAGFIGSCFLWKLNAEGISDILIVDHMDGSGKKKNLDGKKFLGYMEKGEFLESLEKNKVPKADHVVHMGACSSTILSDKEYYMSNNLGYTKKLAEWSMSNNTPFLYASSAATYGDGSLGYMDDTETCKKLKPLNLYGLSKHLFDMWAIENDLLNSVTGIKFFNVFGPNEYHKGEMRSVICKMFPDVKDKGVIRLFRSYKEEYADGEQKRDFIYIKDAIEVMFYLFSNPGVTGIYNLGTGKARSWNDLARAMFSALGKEPVIEYVEMPETLREKYQYFTEADMGSLRTAGCNIEFQPLEDSIRDYISYLSDGAYL